DYSIMDRELNSLKLSGADYVHIDVMDGVFVPNINFGPKFVKDIRKCSDLVFDTHLMIVEPWKYIEAFANAGADIITIHQEACKDRLSDTLKAIKSLGVKCGAVINPNTPVSTLKDCIELCDMVLLMSVYPGFGGQKFIPEVLEKLKQAKALIDSTGKDIDLEIDGGVTLENAKAVKEAGANVLVAGSTVFNHSDREQAIDLLRRI
ncbi:MAG: ribulose-phosphate 3-epimerase, partial [Clostridia bacterium]|nr:ribulose-phosphate 3-epimerase [Clostridia bacterium]